MDTHRIFRCVKNTKFDQVMRINTHTQAALNMVKCDEFVLFTVENNTESDDGDSTTYRVVSNIQRENVKEFYKYAVKIYKESKRLL
jgi:hypothetical protein